MRNSRLANETGFIPVDASTLQHPKYSNVFALGDTITAPCAKTAAAIFSQTPVLVHNLLQSMDSQSLNGTYNGYGSCPLFVGGNQLMLAEFVYGGVASETFYKNQEVP